MLGVVVWRKERRKNGEKGRREAMLMGSANFDRHLGVGQYQLLLGRLLSDQLTDIDRHLGVSRKF